MADIDIKKDQQTKSSESQRGMMPRSTSMFSLSPRAFFSASPFELMRRFTDEMDRWFEGSGLWSPPIEITERNGKFEVCAELPGLRKEDVKVELTPEGLVISGERKHEREERQEGVYRSERRYGSFCRTIAIPEEAQIDQAKAKFEDGMLKVSIPVPASQRRRRQIPIEEGMKKAG